MSQTERIEVRRIYVGKTMLFGLLYGVLIGLVLGVFIFLTILFGSGIVFGSFSVGAGSIGIALLFAFGMAVAYALVNSIGFAIAALMYNFVSKLGICIDLGLAEAPKKKLMMEHNMNQQYGNVGVPR